MSFPFYRGIPGRARPQVPVELPASRRGALTAAEGYRADPGLAAAVNVALLLRQPLLITGDPGTGKTQLAASLARELGYDEPLKFETKSTSTARDLFYLYDALGRFQARETGAAADPLSYITFCALGEAILLANEPAAVERFRQHDRQRRSVVLIDEIDKAPRDFPNDILNEIDNFYFRIPELQNEKIGAPPEMRPVVVITSNSEKDLPSPFLRRCIYYHIPFPEPDPMRDIVVGRLERLAPLSPAAIRDGLEIFYQLRADGSGLRWKPGTAELLEWLLALYDTAGKDPFAGPADAVTSCVASTLIKNRDDQQKARQLVEQWLKTRA